jgi:peptidoglycan/xylan/chitin deacetylase (PgdA/CDA1 family)
MYHSVADDPPPATRSLSVSPEAFELQMRYLQEQGIATLTFGELMEAEAAGRLVPDRAVVITFDDGYADTAEIAAPVLSRLGLKATVFVTTGWLADAGALAAGVPLARTMTSSQLVGIADQGIEIGGHSHSHAHLDQLGPRALRDELRVSRSLLEDLLSAPVPTLAYPFGHSNRRVRREAVAAGYQAAAAVENVLPGQRSEAFAVPRLTIRRSTTAEEFARFVQGKGLTRAFAVDRALTNGFKVVRAARSAGISREK